MITLPIPPNTLDKTSRDYLIRLIQALTQALDRRTERDVPEGSVLLVSPNGSVYTVAVADDGTLTTELVYDKS